MNEWKQAAGDGLRKLSVCALLCTLVIATIGCASGDDSGDDNEIKVPFTPGEPIDVAPMTWTYVNFPGAKCRDGEETGIGININPA